MKSNQNIFTYKKALGKLSNLNYTTSLVEIAIRSDKACFGYFVMCTKLDKTVMLYDMLM